MDSKQALKHFNDRLNLSNTIMPTNVIMQMKWTNQFLKKSKLTGTDKMNWPIFIKENALIYPSKKKKSTRPGGFSG